MSDHFVDPEYQPFHVHDPLGGTPHMEDELQYRHVEHSGRNVNLNDEQFARSYPTTPAPSSKLHDFPDHYGNSI
jgi:hypothetical protein